MSLLIRNLFELDLLKDATLVAGGNGLNNEITWITIMEILDEISHLNKGELLLTTGYMLDNENLHENLIFDLLLRGVSGLIIQPGYYLNKIPNYIIDAANKYNFPIIEIPKHLSFSGITQIILRNVYDINFYSSLQKNNYLLQNLNVGKNPSSSEKSEIIQKLNLNVKPYLCIFLLSATSTYHNIVPEDTILHIIHQLCNYFNFQNSSVICENFNDKVVFLVSSNERLSTQNLTTDLSEVIAKLYETLPDIILLIGASNIFNNINDLLISYQEACTSHATLKKMKIRKAICFYNYISLFNSLNLINSNEFAAKSLYKKIESLINYDKIHQTSYFDTLKYFLDSGCNTNTTSEKLYIHRHTLRNRLEKIKELFNIDFNDNYLKLTFSIAICLYNFFPQ